MKFDECPECDKDFDAQNEYDFQFHRACGWNSPKREESKTMIKNYYGLVVGGPMAGQLIQHECDRFSVPESKQLTFDRVIDKSEGAEASAFVYKFKDNLQVGTGPRQSFNYWIPEDKDIEFVMQELWESYQRKHMIPGGTVMTILKNGGA